MRRKGYEQVFEAFQGHFTTTVFQKKEKDNEKINDEKNENG